jgi:hypothetical protein
MFLQKASTPRKNFGVGIFPPEDTRPNINPAVHPNPLRETLDYALVPRTPNTTAQNPAIAIARPPKMYQAVSWVNRPVKVLLTWSAVEWDALIPTISKTTPMTSRTIPTIRCVLMTDSEL